jgi:hypothetical protein
MRKEDEGISIILAKSIGHFVDETEVLLKAEMCSKCPIINDQKCYPCTAAQIYFGNALSRILFESSRLN